MKTISIISHKGGAGKTSSAVMLAEDLARRGLRVGLVDADRHRGAGIMVGVEQGTGEIQQTRDPRLRYLCSSSLPLRELGAKAEEMAAQVDVAVVDTPSLDDPLAKGWIQLSSEALVVLPVEPISMRTLDGADAALDTIRKLNPQIHIVGILPTMFDDTDATQRTLMLELQAQRGDDVLPMAIPLDPGLTHRAEQKIERRTEPSETTRAAYRSAGDFLVETLDLKPAAPAPAGVPAARPVAAPVTPPERRPPVNVVAPVCAAPPRSGGSPLGWVVAIVVVLALLALGAWRFLRPGRMPGLSGARVGVHRMSDARGAGR